MITRLPGSVSLDRYMSLITRLGVQQAGLASSLGRELKSPVRCSAHSAMMASCGASSP